MAKTILLADDSITIQKVVELTFSDGDYNVVAVSNGARAIERLAELQPDIILSDIIMPEKNGYEVCEFVKSHPEYRHIPVVLLTGTFEPFDPDRAEKAGCDAVVTKPFESQSLIHKVEELIAQAPAAAAPASEAADTPAEAPAGGWDEVPAEPEPPTGSTGWGEPASAWATPELPTSSEPAESSFEIPPPTAAEPAWGGSFSDTPAADSADSGIGRSDDASDSEPARRDTDDASAAPWNTPEDSGAFAEHDSSAFASGAEPPAFSSAVEPESPFGSGGFESGATQAFPRMSFDDIQKMQGDPLQSEVTTDQPQSETSADASDAFQPSPSESPAAADSGPWSEAPSWSGSSGDAGGDSTAEDDGSTRMIPRMSLDEIRRMQAEQETTPAGEDDARQDGPQGELVAFSSPFSPAPEEESVESTEEPAPFESSSSWDSAPTETSSEARDAAPETEDDGPIAEAEDAPFGQAAATAEDAETPFAESPQWDSAPLESTAEEAAPSFDDAPVWETPASSFEPSVETPEPPPAEPQQAWDEPAPMAATAVDTGSSRDAAPSGDVQLSDEQVDRIARRVVELISEDLVRRIAWEVIPDMAETVVRERLRELEAEA